jgi:hypothetical protein
MKKQLLMIAAVAVTLTASAQNKRMLSTTKVADTKTKSLPVEPISKSSSQVAVSANKNGGASTMATVQLSVSPNAFGGSGGIRSLIWADPSINAVSLIHRNAPSQTGTGISGDLNADYSIDGGATFSINLPVYAGAATAGPLFPARYPSGAIYNPVGNTVAANAYAVAVGPTLDGSNLAGSWGGFANGSNMMMSGMTPVSSDTPSDNANGYFQYIPSGMQVIKNTGNCMVLDASIDLAADYTDNLILRKGVWTSGAYAYTKSLVPVPVSTSAAGSKALAEQTLAFSDDGMIGYIVCLGHNDFNAFPDEAYYPFVYKTVDGGTTWTGPTNLDISPLEAVIPAYDGTTGNLVSTSFELDAVVDGANNLHIVTSACAGAGAFSIYQGAGASTIVDIYTTDGGTTWAAQELGIPMTGRGTFGDASTANPTLNHDNRAQGTRNWDGTKLMFTWFDTDTNNFAGLGNTYPDAYSVGLNTATGLWTSMDPAVSLKTNAATLMFGDAAYYAFDANGAQTVPVAYMAIGGSTATGEPLNTGASVDNYYTSDVAFVDADYTVAGTPIAIPVVTGINDVQTIVASSISLVPNPANGSTKLTYLLNSSSDVSVKVVNLIGAAVSSMVLPAQTAGQHEVQLNVADLKAGVYFVNVTAKGSVSTSKLIIK